MLITNNGAGIASTDYWDSPHAKRGYVYLTWNAGAARLLVPDVLSAAIGDMRVARYVVVSRGRWNGRDALELMFEDGSDSPYCLHIVAEQSDRMLPETDQGSGFDVAVWTRAGLQAQLPGRYRVVRTLPCLDAWSEH